MQDYQKHLEKLRRDAAECELIANLASDPAKRDLFARLAKRHATLADEVEREMAARRAAGQ